MDQMVEITVDGDWFATLRVEVGEAGVHFSENAYVAKAQALLATRGLCARQRGHLLRARPEARRA
jgi:hypothetical protein